MRGRGGNEREEKKERWNGIFLRGNFGGNGFQRSGPETVPRVCSDPI